MNHQDIEQLFSRARTLRLTEKAKETGRAALLARMNQNSHSARPVSHFAWLRQSWLRAGAFASLLLLIGGTALAAEGALPGDVLYTWKTKVNEPARLVLLPTPVSRAEWSVELISRRLGEAEALASNGQLDDETQMFLEEKLNQERDRADEYSQSAGDENCAEIEAEIKTRIESVRHVEVREDSGRLRIRVREEHEEKESEDEKRRENEIRHEDGWIEETELHEGQLESEDETEEQESRAKKVEAEKTESNKKAAETKVIVSSTKSSSAASGSTKTQTSSGENERNDEADASADNQEELISESSARSKAVSAVPGTVEESELKDEEDDPVWEVKIRRSSDNEDVKVIVNARSGNIEEIED